MNIKLDGIVIASFYGGGSESVCDFSIGDIFISQKNQWLKENSTDNSSFFMNLQILKAAGKLRFYTSGKYGGGSRAMSNHPSNMLFKEVAAKYKIFKLQIYALANKANVIAKCENCEMEQSVLIPTPFGGMLQCIDIKYSDMSLVWF